jgi:galactose mutarotase-like enzyme
MPHHGFARLKHWHAEGVGVDDASAHARASYRSNGEDHGIYPFDYRLDSGVTLIDSTITLTMRVTAAAANDGPMPFTIGQHVTFDLASWWGDDWLLGTIHGLGRSARGIDPLMLAGDHTALPQEPVTLSDPLVSDLLIPAVPGKPLRLVSPDNAKHIELTFSSSSLPSEDATLWVTHCDPAGRFFCLEPWVGWPNGINSGKGRIELQPGEAWSFSLQMSIMPASQQTPATNTVPGEIHINPAAMDPALFRKRTQTTIPQRATEE